MREVIRENLPDNPSVTVAIPTLNEENYIREIINTFQNDLYPFIKEILVADGGSSDKTRAIVEEISKSDSSVRLLDNPNVRQVFAFNDMLDIAQGDLFMLAGAHAEYPENYISHCVELIKGTQALNVGASTRLAAKCKVQAGILIATYSFLGNGGAKHKRINYSGYTDTLFPGFYITEVLRKVGGFNIENIANQDTEINARISQISDKAHYVSGDLQVYYYPRDTFKGLLRQYFVYGRGRCISVLRHFPKSAVRGYISFLFLWLLIALTQYLIMYDLHSWLKNIYIGLGIILIIDVVRTLISVEKAEGEKYWRSPDKKPNYFQLLITAVASVVLMHIGMWSGFTFQLIKNSMRFSNRW